MGHTLVRVLSAFGWMKYAALEVRRDFLIVLTLELEITTVSTTRMLELSVKVSVWNRVSQFHLSATD